MSDVTIKFGADATEINRALADMANTGKRAAKGVKEPFDSILESEKKVERSISNVTRSIANMATPADAVASIIDNMENSFKGSMMVGGAAAIGMALNQALTEAAKGMDAFSGKVEASMKEAFDGSVEGLDKMRAMIDDLAADKADDGLFERLIFGGQKEELIASQEKALELAQKLVTLKKEAESAEALAQASRQTRADRLRYGSYDENTFSGAEDKTRAGEEVSWIELQLKQYAELKKAQEEHNKILKDKTASEMTKANYKEILEQVKERQKLESDALETTITVARERRKLDRDLAEQARNDAIEQLAMMTEREKLHLNLEQAEEKLNTLTSSRAATEKEIQDAKFAQIKAAAELKAWAQKEIDIYADITKMRLERNQIGKSDLDQQRVRVRMLEEEAAGLEGIADKAEEYEKKLTELAGERLKLKQAEREEEEKLRDIQHERIQMAEKDPYLRAQNAAQWAKEKAAEIAARPDASESQKQQAALDAEIKRQDLLDAAAAASPSLAAIAATDPASMKALSRAANRGGPSRFMEARQAQARYALAAAQRASDPYSVSTQERAARTQRKAEIQEGQAKGYLDRTPNSGDRSDWETMPENKWQEFKRESENSAKDELERKQRQKEADRERERDPIGDYKKRNKLDGEEEGKEDPSKVSGQEGPKTEPKAENTMEQNIAAIANWANTAGVLYELNKKLPQQVLV